MSDISNSIPAGMVAVNREFRVTWYNHAWAERFSRYFSRDLVIGASFYSLIPDNRIEKMLAEALAGRTAVTYCHRFVNERPTEAGRDYDMVTFPVRSKKGEITGAVLMATDVTERQRKVRGIESARNEAEFYVDLMSHDIRNFNQITMGYIELLQLAESLGDMERAYLEKAQKGIFGSNKLIDNIKKIRLIRQFAGKNLVRMDLNELLNKDTGELISAFPAAEITLNIEPGIKYYVLGDEYINEIFRHVMENAVKYDPHEKKIIDIAIVSADIEGRDYWLVSVADRGIGIPDENKKSIFERIDKTTKGAGVGLSIVRVLVGKYNGLIWVEDRVKGEQSKGSVFYVELPKA